VNGGLARSEGRRVTPSAGASGETAIRESGSAAHHGREPAQDPGWREIVIQRLPRRQKRCGGRGTGAVRATGSYEGYLPIEGISDHHEASPFTGRRQRWSRRSPAPSDPFETFQKKDGRPGCSAREGERGARVNQGSRQGCQRLDRIVTAGRRRPRRISGREASECEARDR
jgi:hypothetical protein